MTDFDRLLEFINTSEGTVINTDTKTDAPISHNVEFKLIFDNNGNLVEIGFYH